MNYFWQGKRIAVTGIAIGEPQDIGRSRDTTLNGIGHFAETHQIHVWHRQAHCRNARPGDKAGAKAGFLDKPGAHSVPATRHHLQPWFVEKCLQRSSLRTHFCFPWMC
jgi:hypothetical protein